MSDGLYWGPPSLGELHDALREGHENGKVVTICAPKIGHEFDSRVGPILVIDGRRYSVEAAKQLHAELGQALDEVLP